MNKASPSPPEPGSQSEARPARAKALRGVARIGRPPKGKTLLSRSRLMKEALAILDAQGKEALSMRALAERLGVTAMSLYRYFDSHDALLDAIYDEILSSHPPKPVTREQSWREVMTELARALRRTMVAHPNAVSLFATRSLRASRLAPHLDRVLGSLVAAGFDLYIAGYLLDAVSCFTVGHALSEFGWSGVTTTLPAPASPAGQTSNEATSLPYLLLLGESKASQDRDSEFVVSLVAILDGFGQRYLKRGRA